MNIPSLRSEVERLTAILDTVRRECRSADGAHAVPLPPDLIEAIDGLGHSNAISDAQREVERLRTALEAVCLATPANYHWVARAALGKP